MVEAEYIDITYRVELQKLLNHLRPLIGKLKLSGKIPSGLKLTSQIHMNFDEFFLLHNEICEVDKYEVFRRFNGTSTNVNYDKYLSRLLTLHDETVGLSIVFTTSESTAFIYGIYVKEKWRRSWPTALLKSDTFEELQLRGVSVVEFIALNGNQDTVRHANRVNARRL